MLHIIDTSTLEAVPAIAILHDPEGNILWGNSRFLQAVSRTLDEVEGLRCHEAWGLKTPCDSCPVRKALETGACAQAELSPETQENWPEDGGAWLARAVPVTDDQGEVRGALEVVFQITRWKEIQRLARDEKVFSSTIIDQSPMPMWVSDGEGYVVKVNAALLKTLNLSRDQVLGKYNVLKDDNLRKQGLAEQVEAVFKEYMPARFTMKWNPENAGQIDFSGGRDVFIDVALFPVLSDSGELESVVCQWLDITGRMEALEDLKASEEKFRTITEAAPDAIFIIDKEGNYIYVNRAACEMLNYSREELLSMNIRDLTTPDDTELPVRHLKDLMESKKLFTEMRLRKKDGTVIHADLNAILLPNGTIFGSCRDLTERDAMNRTLRRSQRLLSFAVEQIPIPLIIASAPDVEITHFNRAVSELLAKEPEDVRDIPLAEHRDFWPTYHPDGTPYDIADLPLTRAVKYGCVTTDTEIIVRKDDGDHWISASAAPLKDENGEIMAGIVAFPEITRLKRTEKDLEEKELFAKKIADTVPAHVYIYDLEEQRNIWCNDHHRRTLEKMGLDPLNLSYEKAKEMVYPEDFRKFERVYEELFTDPSKENVNVQLRMKMTGGWRWMDLYTSVFRRNENGNVLQTIGALFDIHERKKAELEKRRLQQQLTQAQKMESVGRLAGGVAHDFNNMLSVILGHSDMVLDSMKENDPLRMSLQEIHKAAQRSADLTRQLLAFARRQTVTLETLDLNETIESMLKMLKRLIAENIQLEWKPAERMEPVRIDPAQIDQIMANLVVNARDAISGTGLISIETDLVELEGSDCAGSEMEPGVYAKLTVSDDGRGMDRETKALIFEPFFTTKAVGEGTGLGLATVYGIVKQNSGHINVYSEPGKGTIFRIYLPVLEEDHDGDAEQTDADDEAESRGETVLLAEDEASILEMTTRMLKGLGYRVFSASSPEEAIVLARENSGEIDLLITDVVMPQMNGRELAKRAGRFNPNLKCLFISGYTADVIAHHGVLDDYVHFLQKPFTRKELSENVRNCLESNDHISGKLPGEGEG